MGNHCCASSTAIWAAESMKLPHRPMERDHDHHDDHPEYGSSVEGTTGGQVRIRISKKQLEELLNKAAMDASTGAPKKDQLKLDQALLQRLIDESYDLQIQNQDHDHHFHQRPWKPALQSIPEIN